MGPLTLCAICGEGFEQKKSGRVAFVCGDECRAEYARRAMRAKYRSRHGLPANLGPRWCCFCQKEFVGEHCSQRYCTKECAAEAARKRDRESRRSGPGIRDVLACADCGLLTPKLGPRTKRCQRCQQAFRAGASRRHRERDPERSRLLDTKAAAARRSTKEGAEAYRERCRLWRKAPKNRLRCRMASMMNRCLSTGKGGRSWAALVPYGIDDLRIHIERQFTKGMTWDNMGEWHLDHIVPVASFNFSSAEDDEFKACFALANLRPMWAKENQRKSAKRIFLI